jgi:hypothetical protein
MPKLCLFRRVRITFLRLSDGGFGMFREMRRKKQQLSDEECVEILKKEPRGN